MTAAVQVFLLLGVCVVSWLVVEAHQDGPGDLPDDGEAAIRRELALVENEEAQR